MQTLGTQSALVLVKTFSLCTPQKAKQLQHLHCNVHQRLLIFLLPTLLLLFAADVKTSGPDTLKSLLQLQVLKHITTAGLVIEG